MPISEKYVVNGYKNGVFRWGTSHTGEIIGYLRAGLGRSGERPWTSVRYVYG